MDLSSGAFSGTEQVSGQGFTDTADGSTSGNNVTMTLTDPPTVANYTEHRTGQVSADGLSMSGTWNDNEGHTGTWSASRTTGLVSWWKADGNANDNVGTNNGTLIGTQPAAGWYVSGPPGDPGQAFNLNGSDDYVDVPNSPSENITGTISLSAWVNWASDNSNATGGPVIAGKYDTHDTQTSYFLSILNHGQVQWKVTSDCNSLAGNGRSVYAASAVVQLGHWTEVTGTFDPATQAMHILINGMPVATTLVESGTVTSLCQSGTDFRIGAAEDINGALQFFPGQIDEVKLYNQDISANSGGHVSYGTVVHGSAGRVGSWHLPVSGCAYVHVFGAVVLLWSTGVQCGQPDGYGRLG